MTHAEKTVPEPMAALGKFGVATAKGEAGAAAVHRADIGAGSPEGMAGSDSERVAGCDAGGLWSWYRMLRRHVPTDCPLCGGRSRGALLCAACEAVASRTMRGDAPRCQVCMLLLDGRLVCPDCRALPQSCERIIAAFDYAPPGDELIRSFKAGRRFLLAPALAASMARAIRDAPVFLPGRAVLVPVPARRDSVRQRGFSPAAELARSLARELSMPSRAHWLLRVREGERQTHRSRRQRLQAGLADFHCPVRLDGAVVMVVDDVLTTGTTLHRAAQCLRAAGAVRVLGAVLARTPWQAS